MPLWERFCSNSPSTFLYINYTLLSNYIYIISLFVAHFKSHLHFLAMMITRGYSHCLKKQSIILDSTLQQSPIDRERAKEWLLVSKPFSFISFVKYIIYNIFTDRNNYPLPPPADLKWKEQSFLVAPWQMHDEPLA